MIRKLVSKGIKFFNIISYFGKWGRRTIVYNVGKKARFRVRVNTADMFTVFEVWRRNEYINSNFDIKKDDIVVDIGANIGSFSVLAAKKASDGAIFAYEPNKENYHMLLKNKVLNNAYNLFPFNLAIAASKGTMEFFIDKSNTAGHSIYATDSGTMIKVKSDTLKSIFRTNGLKRINYLKIDAEGAEYDILLNTSSDVLRKIDKIVLEYHDYLEHNHSCIDLKRYLEKNGFKVEVCRNALFGFLGRIFGVGMIKALRKNS